MGPVLSQLLELPLRLAAVVTCAALIAYKLAKAIRAALAPRLSPLRVLKGPQDNRSWLLGHDRVMYQSEDLAVSQSWYSEFGSTFATRGLLGCYRLNTMDPRALQHIFFQTDVWQKPEFNRRGIVRILGKGLFFAEGDDHKIQRRVMNPAFGPAQIRELTEIFLEKSMQLRDIFLAKSIHAQCRVDVLNWLSRTALDIIGLAGFDYAFDALNESGKQNELSASFDRLFRNSTRANPTRFILFNLFPFLRYIFGNRKMRQVIDGAKSKMDTLGRQLIVKKKKAIHTAEKDGGRPPGRDILTLLLQKNMSSDVPSAQRLTDDDVLAQVPTFLIAGHETTSTATTWTLFELAKDQALQDRLRQEVQSVDTDLPSMDSLNSLPLLDAIVRETLRLHSPVALIQRAALCADVIPLQEPVVGSNGELITEIRVRAGDVVFIPVQSCNRSEMIWGPDAREFRPERWTDPPAGAGRVPGIMSGLLTFLGGPRACIGWKFAIVEMKALLFHLVRSVRFELAVPLEQIGTKSGMLSRPYLRSDNSVQLPLLVSHAPES